MALAPALLARCSRSGEAKVPKGEGTERGWHSGTPAPSAGLSPPCLSFPGTSGRAGRVPTPGAAWAPGSPVPGNPLAQGSHTHQVPMGAGMPHTGGLWGSLVLGTFLGAGIPHGLSTSRAQSFPVPGAYGHRDPTCRAPSGHRELSCRVLYRHEGVPALDIGVSPHRGCCKDTGTPSLPPRSLCTDPGIPADPFA